MNQTGKKHHFKDIQTGYHRAAVQILASWTGGQAEVPFKLGGKYYFTPDVVCFENGVITAIYEVTYKNPFTAAKYGKMQYWAYVNAVDLTIYEVSADWILSQTERPERIETMECYTITTF